MLTIKKIIKRNDNEISIIIDEYLKYIKIKRDEYKVEFENGKEDYRKKYKEELEKFLDKKLGDLGIGRKNYKKLLKMIC